MANELHVQKFRPTSLSLVTVTSHEKNRVIFNLTDCYKNKTKNYENFFDINTIGTPSIVIDSESNHNSPPKRKRPLPSDSECESVLSVNSIASKRGNRSPESFASYRSRHSTRDNDTMSIGICSIAPTVSPVHFNPNITRIDSKKLKNQLVNFLSIMYALVLIVVGGIVCAIDLDSEERITNKIFLISITSIGIIWLAFLHLDIYRYKRWAIKYLKPESNNNNNSKQLDNPYNVTDKISITTAVLFNSIAPKPAPDDSSSSTESPFHSAYRFLHGKHSANFYLKCGMTVFCFGSIVHMGVDIFSQAYFFSHANYSKDCHDLLQIFTLVIKSIYSFYQLFMVFKYSNILINRFRIIAKFASMHLMGTSLIYWFGTIVNEAIDDYVHTVHIRNDTYNSSDALFGQSIEHHMHCLEKSIVNKHSMEALPYLYPFTVEYNIILASVWYMVWTNIGKVHSNTHLHNNRKDMSEDVFEEEEIQYHTTLAVSANCQGSNKGLFGGLSTLLAIFITIIVFFTAIKEEKYSVLGHDIYLAQIGSLTIISCIVIPLAYIQTRKLDIVGHQHMNNSFTSIDDLLVLVPVPFFVLHYMLLIGAFLENPPEHCVLLIFIYTLTIIQVLIQSPFIVDGIRRCANSKKLRVLKPGRGLVTYALILNITLWILNTFELKSVDSYHGMQDNYGKIRWIMSHTTLPLILFYRFHSSVCLSDIWKYAYEKD